MIIEITKLIPDKENPRFLVDNSFETEEKIYEYMIENEDLKELIKSIKSKGFIQIGERIIVIKDETTDKFIVVEGNRRLCALKAIHGLFEDKNYSTEDDNTKEIKKNTKQIDVDLANSREDVQSTLAMRHIEGALYWGPEAKRNFYAKHYMNEMSINDIIELTRQGKKEITDFIEQYMFLSEFKNIAEIDKIKKPSFIYERLFLFLKNAEIITSVNVGQSKKDWKISFTKNIDEKERKELFKELAKMILTDGKLDSRTANKYSDFINFVESEIIKKDYPKFTDIYNKFKEAKEKEKFSPKQKISESYIGKVPSLETILELGHYKKENFKFYDKESKEINYDNFIIAKEGKYKIYLDDKKIYYTFEIKALEQPRIEILKSAYQCNIGESKSFSEIFEAFNQYNEKISCFDSRISVTSKNPEVTIGKSNILIDGPDAYEISITFKEGLDTIIKPLTLSTKPIQLNQTGKTIPNNYFHFQFVEQEKKNFDNEKNIAKLLEEELESAYKNKQYYIFASALRSILEIRLDTFFEKSKSVKGHNTEFDDNYSKWCDINKFFDELGKNGYRKISNKFTTIMKTKNIRTINNNKLNDYLTANINYHMTMSALHLGAHGSLNHINKQKLDEIKASICAWLELLAIIEEISFNY